MNSDDIILLINQGNKKESYKRTDINEQYRRIKPVEGCNYRVLRRLYKNKVIKIMYKQEEDDDESSYDSDNWYNKENRVVDAIRSNIVIAVCNALVKDNIIGRW